MEIWKEGIFGIGCLAVGLMLSLGLVSKKASFLVGLNGAHGARRGRVRALEKNPFSKQTKFGSWALVRGSGPGMQKLT